MVIVKKDTQVFFNGGTLFLSKGIQYKEDAGIVQAKPELFEGAKSAPKVKKAKKVEAVKVIEEPKEELLIEEPVGALVIEEKFEIAEEVSEEVSEETEEKPKRKKRK
jgi:hypothetical protein